MVLALPSSCAHFSCAGWDTLPELKAGRQDGVRTKERVAIWREYYIRQCGGWSGRT